MDINLELLIKFYNKNNKNITKAAREYAFELNLDYNDSFRRKCSNILNEHLVFEEVEEIDSIMTALSDDGTVMNIEEYCKFYEIDFNHVKSYKLVTHTGTPYYNITSNNIDIGGDSFKEFQEKLIEDIKTYSPKFTKVDRTPVEDGHLLVLCPSDLHIGKLASSFEGEDYNSEVAVKRAKEGVEGILKKASGFNIDQILFRAGDDILHIDNPHNTTTSGTRQDTDGMWFESFLKAKQLYIELIEMLLTIAPVHFQFIPSNHDMMSGFMLAQTIYAYFRNYSDVTWDIDMKYRKYYQYGNNLIAGSHEFKKPTEVSLIFADECSFWSESKRRYGYFGHVHHKISEKDLPGITLETLRSASNNDSWHTRNQYVSQPKAVEGFVHHKSLGQIARITHLF